MSDGPEIIRVLGDAVPDKRQRISLRYLAPSVYATRYVAHERSDGSILLTPVRVDRRGDLVHAGPKVCMDPECLNDSDHAAH